MTVPTQREPHDIADQRAAQRRPVAAGGGGDLDRWAVGRLQQRGAPRRESASGATQPLLTRDGRDHRAGRWEQCASRRIQVVAVVVVGQQDRRHLAYEPFLTGRLEGLAGDYPVSVEQYLCPQCNMAAANIIAGNDIVIKSLICQTEESGAAHED